MGESTRSCILRAKYLKSTLMVLCSIGIAVSAYAYHVETSKESDSSYTAYCDLSEYISCSKVFTSRYGRGFGLLEHISGKHSFINQPNSVFGIIFYLSQILLGFWYSLTSAKIQIAGSSMANCGSVYLGYILRYVLGDFCVVCVSMYVINFLIFVVNILIFKNFKNLERQKKKRV